MSIDPPAQNTPMSERMQSLLSRAVEDQLSEQRQLAAALTDLRAQLQHVTDEVSQLRSSSGAGAGSDGLAAISADIREAVRLLAERLDGVAGLVQQRGVDLAELKSQTADLQATVRAHGDALGGISGGLGALPAFGDRVSSLQDNLNGLQDNLNGLHGRFDAVDALQQRVDAVDQGLRELRSAFSAVGARMAEVPARSDLDAAAQRTAEPVARLQEQLARVEASVAQLASQDQQDPTSDALRTELARFAETMAADAAAQQERLAGVEAQLRTLGTHAENQQATLAELATPAVTDDPVRGELADLRNELLGPGGLAARLEAAQATQASQVSQLAATTQQGPGLDDLDARVTAAVEQATEGLEQRLTAHVDEAVLALAEALLRRRARPAAPLATAFDTGPIPTIPPAPSDAPAHTNDVPAPATPTAAAEPAYDDSAVDAAAWSDTEAVHSPAAPEAVAGGYDHGLAVGVSTEETAEAGAGVAADAVDTTAIELPDVGGAAAAQEAEEPGESTAPPRWEPEHWRRDEVEAVADSSVGAGGHEDASRRRRPWWRPGD